MNQTITNAIESVNNAYPSIYTKDDVIALLTGIDEKLNTGHDLEEIKDVLISNIERKLNNMSNDDIAEYDTAEFELDYDNRISLTSIDIDTNNLIDAITDAVDETIEFINNEE